MEAEHAPEILKVTDEQGLPVQAEVRISLWQGEPPAPQTIFAPVLINNDTDIENAYARKFAESKPFLMEFRGVLTSVCIFGGLVISCVILVLFFFKMLTGYVPLLVSLSGGTVCLLLAVSLYHNHQLPSLGVLQRTESASHDVTLLKSTSRTNSFAKSEELLEAEVTQIPTSPQSTLLHQWHGATDARGMFILEPHQEESLREEIDSATSEPRSFWIEASDPEGRIGAFELKR